MILILQITYSKDDLLIKFFRNCCLNAMTAWFPLKCVTNFDRIFRGKKRKYIYVFPSPNIVQLLRVNSQTWPADGELSLTHKTVVQRSPDTNKEQVNK